VVSVRLMAPLGTTVLRPFLSILVFGCPLRTASADSKGWQQTGLMHALGADRKVSDSLRVRFIDEASSSTRRAASLDDRDRFAGGIGQGQVVYENVGQAGQRPPAYFAPGAGVLVMDDLFLKDCGKLFRPSIRVYAPEGTGRYSVILIFWYVDERNLLVPLLDSYCEVTGISSGAVYDPGVECRFGPMVDNRLPRSLWLGLIFSNHAAGWVICDQAEQGSTDDVFLACGDSRCDSLALPAHWSGFCARVTAILDEPQLNDACANAIRVLDGRSAQSTCSTTTDGPAHSHCFPNPPYEPDGQQIYRDLWYTYQAPCNGHATISVCEGNFDTMIAVFEGLGCADLESRRLGCNDDSAVCGEDSLRSSVTVSVTCGQWYLIRVGGFLEQMGDFSLSIGCVGDSCQTECGDRNVCTTGKRRGDVCCYVEQSRCDDCNLDQVADTAEIAEGCARFVGLCQGDSSWECAANWSTRESYPGNGSAVNQVSLGDGDSVTLNVDATLRRLRMTGDSELKVAAGDLTMDGAGIVAFVGGSLLVGRDHSLHAEDGELWIAADGILAGDPLGNPVGSGRIFAGAITVDAGNPPVCESVVCGGAVWLTGDMSLTVRGDLVLDGSRSGEFDPLNSCVSDAIHDGFGTPPTLLVNDLGQTVISKNLRIIDSANLQYSSGHNLVLGGDFENRSRSPELFVWTQSGVAFHGDSIQNFEVAGRDLGPADDGLANGADTNFSMGTMDIAKGTNVRFTNLFPNTAGTGPCVEALYVHDMVLAGGSAVTLDDCKVYYENLVDGGATVQALGCGGLGPMRLAGLPPNRAIDATQPASPQNALPEGWRSVVLTNVPKSASKNDLEVAVEPGDVDLLPPPSITMVLPHPSGGVEVFFDQPVPPGHWTILTYLPTRVTTRLGVLPGDIDGDGEVLASVDVQRFLGCLSGFVECRAHASDIDRSIDGAPNVLDLARILELLIGSAPFQPWEGRRLPI